MGWPPNWLLVAGLGQVLLGLASVFDKTLLRRGVFNPWAYAFWLGILGAFTLFVLPFGHLQVLAISTGTFFLAQLSGITFGIGLFLLFYALARGEASVSLPIIAGFSTLFTYLFSIPLLQSRVDAGAMGGLALLVLGGLTLFWVEERSLRRITILLTLLSALSLGFSQVLIKLVFEQSSFIAGFVWTKIGGVVLALAALAIPGVRAKIKLRIEAPEFSREGMLYLSNRLLAGIGSFLFSAAIFLQHPALVEATLGIQYAIIFVLGWFFLRERFGGMVLGGKVLATVFIGLGIAWLAFHEYVKSLPAVDPGRKITWGVTFSQKFSRELGLDWQENYLAILNELRPSALRLVAYWDALEPEDDRFSFTDLDWQLARAAERGIPVILAVGLRLPRWPECHIPSWAQGLSIEEREEKLRAALGEVTGRYRTHPEIAAWQVENEPFLPLFGVCPERGARFLERGIALVRGLDAGRPIIVTDSGELGLWFRAERRADIFGTTMYRKVYLRFIGPLWGAFEYPLPPDFFRLKERYTRFLSRHPAKRFIVVELQGEPWEPRSLAETPYETAVRDFSPEYFRDTIAYARATGFDEYHLWGAEWWWFMKEQRADSRYWDIARALFSETMKQ